MLEHILFPAAGHMANSVAIMYPDAKYASRKHQPTALALLRRANLPYSDGLYWSSGSGDDRKLCLGLVADALRADKKVDVYASDIGARHAIKLFECLVAALGETELHLIKKLRFLVTEMVLVRSVQQFLPALPENMDTHLFLSAKHPHPKRESERLKKQTSIQAFIASHPGHRLRLYLHPGYHQNFFWAGVEKTKRGVIPQGQLALQLAGLQLAAGEIAVLHDDSKKHALNHCLQLLGTLIIGDQLAFPDRLMRTLACASLARVPDLAKAVAASLSQSGFPLRQESPMAFKLCQAMRRVQLPPIAVSNRSFISAEKKLNNPTSLGSNPFV